MMDSAGLCTFGDFFKNLRNNLQLCNNYNDFLILYDILAILQNNILINIRIAERKILCLLSDRYV